MVAVWSAMTLSAGADDASTSLIEFRWLFSVSASAAVCCITARMSSVRDDIVVTKARDSRIIAASPSPSCPTAEPTPLRTRVRLPITPPLTSIDVEASTSSTVAAARVEVIGMRSPSWRTAAPSAGAGCRNATKMSPSGVADRSSAVVPVGSRTSARIRISTTAV